MSARPLSSPTHPVEQHDELQQAISWLGANRHLYAGQWIALDGSRLLAVGATGKEVYAKIADQFVSSLVVRVEDDLPFAGW